MEDNLTVNTDATAHNQHNLLQTMEARMMKDQTVVWLMTGVETADGNATVLIKLQQIVNVVQTFTDPDQCIDFITNLKDAKVFLIISQLISPTIVSIIGEIPQLYSIYVFDCQKTHNTQSIQGHKKIKGVFAQMDSICDALKLDIARLMVSLASFSVISTTSSPNLDELDPSFMYSQLIKEIILEIQPNDNERQQFVSYLRNSGKSEASPKSLETFQRSYTANDAILCYARESFLYATINKALRLQDTKTIIKMAFFLRDLHRQIEQKHSKTQHTTKMIVYRGQGMSNVDFENLKKNEGGLLSFNSFLSTSTDPRVPHMFLGVANRNSEMVDILFRIEIDPSVTVVPFVMVNDTGDSGSNEQEVLFSMHTVFRIGKIHENKNHVCEVNLTATSDNDPQLKRLLGFIRAPVGVMPNSWYRMGILMQMMGKYDEALDIYENLLQTTRDDDPEFFGVSKVLLTNNVADMQLQMSNYLSASECLKKILAKYQDTFLPDHAILVRIYNSIAMSYHFIGEYAKALSYFEKALQLWPRCRSSNDPSLGLIYNNIAEMHQLIGNSEMALSYGKKALEICQKSLPSDHPNLVYSYNNIGLLYLSMGNYEVALSYMEKAREICQKSLSSDHPNLAYSYNNIGLLHQSMGNYEMALSYMEKALDIWQKSLPSNHPNLGLNYHNISVLYQSMGNYEMALSYAEKALEIWQKSLPSDHPNLAYIYNNLGALYKLMSNSEMALSYMEKALEIWKKSLPSDHPNLGLNYNNISVLYRSMGNYKMALSYGKKALEIWQNSLPSDHPNLGLNYNNIGVLYHSMGNYEMALSYMEKALDIWQKSLPSDHPNLAYSYNNLGALYRLMGNYKMALSYAKKTLEIWQKSLPSDHPNLGLNYNNIGVLYQSMGNYEMALSYMEKALEIWQKSLPSNHPTLTTFYETIAEVYKSMEE